MTESPHFGDAWTAAQQTLAESVTSIWVEHGQWPTYQWVDHYMARHGLDAVETLSSFPTIGGPHAGGLIYGDVDYERSIAPTPGRRVRLTVAGLARQQVPRCGDRVTLFLHLLRTAAALERDTEIDPLTVTELKLTSAQLSERVPPQLRNGVPSLYDDLDQEPVQGFASRGGGGPDGSWNVTVDTRIRAYRAVESIDDYLAIVRRQLAPRPAPPPPRVLPSPVSLATALGYLDVTWQLHRKRRLLQEVTDLAGATGLAFEVGNEDEFRSRCSALMDLIGNWDVPGVSGGGGGHPLQRLAAYLAENLDEDGMADARGALDVLDAVRRIRTGQQHAHRSHAVITALSELGVAGPPFDWASAWSTLRERVTLAVLDLQTAVARLPR